MSVLCVLLALCVRTGSSVFFYKVGRAHFPFGLMHKRFTSEPRADTMSFK